MTGVNHALKEQSSTSNLQYANCCLCEGQQSKDIFLSKDYNWGISGVFRYVRCDTCGFIYENPRPIPDRIMGFYPHSVGHIRRAARAGIGNINYQLETEVPGFRYGNYRFRFSRTEFMLKRVLRKMTHLGAAA